MQSLAEQGFDRMRIDDVAELAGVSKTTIYRRAATKVQLVLDGLERMKTATVPMPDTGTVEGDLRSLVYDLYDSLNETPLGGALAGLLAEKSRDPDLAEGITRLWAARQKKVRSVIRRGIRTGAIKPGLTEAAVLDLLAAPAYYRLLVSGEPLTRAAAKRHADALILAVTP